VVPGNFSIGCNAGILSRVNSHKKEDYDEFACLIAYNTFMEYYNAQLKKFYRDIKTKTPTS